MRTATTLLLILTLSLSGCVTWTPAVGGKTHVRTLYENENLQAISTSGEVVQPGDKTRFEQEIDAPAGTDIKAVAAMNMEWQQDGSGKISVAGDNSADTTRQADMLTELNRQQTEAFYKTVMALTDLAVAVSPLVAEVLAAEQAASVLPDMPSTSPIQLPEGVSGDQIRDLLERLGVAPR